MNNESKEFRRRADEMRKSAEELRNTVRDLNKSLIKGDWIKWQRPTVEQLLKEGHKWEEWYAWRPVRDIHGQWHWRKPVYRILGNTYVDQEDRRWYHYGTVFDVLKND